MSPKIKPIEEKYLYNFATYYLNRFPCSINHFKAMMKRKIEHAFSIYQSPPLEECFEMLQKITKRLIEQGYLNDDLYLEGSLNSFKSKGLSNKMIRFKLEQKGLSKNTIDHIPSIDSQEEDLKALITVMKRKKIGPFSLKNEEEQKMKQMAYLARNGFCLETIQKGLRLNLEECLELLNEF
jgi:regulatory protein